MEDYILQMGSQPLMDEEKRKKKNQKKKRKRKEKKLMMVAQYIKSSIFSNDLDCCDFGAVCDLGLEYDYDEPVDDE